MENITHSLLHSCVENALPILVKDLKDLKNDILLCYILFVVMICTNMALIAGLYCLVLSTWNYGKKMIGIVTNPRFMYRGPRISALGRRIPGIVEETTELNIQNLFNSAKREQTSFNSIMEKEMKEEIGELKKMIEMIGARIEVRIDNMPPVAGEKYVETMMLFAGKQSTSRFIGAEATTTADSKCLFETKG